MKKPKQYRLLKEKEFLDLIDEQMNKCDCRLCHAKAMLGQWGTVCDKRKGK